MPAVAQAAARPQPSNVQELHSRANKLAVLLSGLSSRPREAVEPPAPAEQAARPPIRTERYCRELERYSDRADRAELARMLENVESEEVEAVAKSRAVLRARYFAMLLEVTRPGRTQRALDETAVRDIRRHREAFEELDLGLRALQAAIAEGSVRVEGVGE